MQTAREDAAATVLELEAKRLEVTKRRHQLQLSQMVSFEMERKQMQASHRRSAESQLDLDGIHCKIHAFSTKLSRAPGDPPSTCASGCNASAFWGSAGVSDDAVARTLTVARRVGLRTKRNGRCG